MERIEVYHHYFINNCISSLIRGFADYFKNDFFDRSKEIIISTYDKGVQHYLNRKNNNGEKISMTYPCIVFDPNMDFEPDPQTGRFLYGYPNFMGSFATELFKPYIYQDQNITVAPILNRYKGRFDLIVWCSSISELMDLRMQTFQLFGGLNRVITPKNISGYIVLPDEILTYKYENPYNGNSYNIDWESNKAEVELVKNIGQNRMVYPFLIRPWLRLNSVDDGSDKYGGSGDELGDHRLNISMEWESYIPTHIGIVSRMNPDVSKKPDNTLGDREVKVHIDVDIGYECGLPFYDHETSELVSKSAPPTQILNIYGNKNEGTWSDTLMYKDKYNYTITQEDSNNIHSNPSKNFNVYLPENISDPYSLRIYSKFGTMERDYNWKLASEGCVEFIGFNIKALDEGDTIWFAFYQP